MCRCHVAPLMSGGPEPDATSPVNTAGPICAHWGLWSLGEAVFGDECVADCPPDAEPGRYCCGVTPPVIQRWIEIIDTGHTDELHGLLAEDAVFYSPAVFTPQEGRAKTAAYLAAAAKLFADTGFHYVEKWYADHSAVLEFAADIGGIQVNGIDMIHWNDDGRITSVKVMLRPLKALQTVVPEMGKLLQQGGTASTG